MTENDTENSARHRIWEAAIRVMAEKGIEATRIRDIAQAAGVADGALYRHWKGKEDLVGSLFTFGYARMATTLREAAGDGSPTVRLCRLMHAACALFEDDRDGSTFLLMHQREGLPMVPPGADTPVAVIDEIVADGMADGSIRGTDVCVITSLIVGALVMNAQARVYGRQPRPLTEIADELIDCVLAGIAVQKQP